MNIEHIRFSDRSEKLKEMEKLIKLILEKKVRAEVDAKSSEDRIANHFTPIEIEIPKTKEAIDRAIDKFIVQFTPLEDNAVELLEHLGFYDNEPPFNQTNVYMLLHENIKEGKPVTKETEGIVRYVLKELNPEELKELWVFGIMITEEMAKENIEFWVSLRVTCIKTILFYYALGRWKNVFNQSDEPKSVDETAKNLIDLYQKILNTMEWTNEEKEWRSMRKL